MSISTTADTGLSADRAGRNGHVTHCCTKKIATNIINRYHFYNLCWFTESWALHFQKWCHVLLCIHSLNRSLKVMVDGVLVISLQEINMPCRKKVEINCMIDWDYFILDYFMARLTVSRLLVIDQPKFNHPPDFNVLTNQLHITIITLHLILISHKNRETRWVNSTHPKWSPQSTGTTPCANNLTPLCKCSASINKVQETQCQR